MPKKLKKPPVGAHMEEGPDMIAWKDEFSRLKEEDHIAKLSALGLSDEELEEFKEMEHGVPIEDELLAEGPLEDIKEPKKPAKKSSKKGKK